MENNILKTAIKEGLWAVLFVALLFYVLKENSTREKNYQEIIATQVEVITIKLDEVKDILIQK
jgi:hypothetical protein